MIEIRQQLVESRAKAYKGVNPCNYITIHETANTSRGADAQAHANLQTRGFSASWHYTVDNKEVIQSFPDNVRCWHAGDGQGKGNLESIGIEICVNSDGDFKKAVENAVKLTKHLMKKHNIPIERVVQHNRWSGKNCPTNLRNGSKGVNWNNFIKMVEAEDQPSKSQPIQSSQLYRVRLNWNDAKSQIGAYSILSNAKDQVDKNKKYKVFDENGRVIYEIKENKPVQPKPQPKPEPTKPKGDLKTTSIVTYLNSIGVNSSFSNRGKLYKQNGLKGIYLGTAKQNLELLAKMRGGSKPVAQPKPKKKYLQLPKSSSSWRVYPTNKAPVKGNEKGYLNPKKFGGLEYEVIGNPQTDVYTIRTSHFGTVNIYAAKSTGAKIVQK